MCVCVCLCMCFAIKREMLLRKLSRQFTQLVAKTYYIAFGVCISPNGNSNGTEYFSVVS